MAYFHADCRHKDRVVAVIELDVRVPVIVINWHDGLSLKMLLKRWFEMLLNAFQLQCGVVVVD
jgi:hypothetical protein